MCSCSGPFHFETFMESVAADKHNQKVSGKSTNVQEQKIANNPNIIKEKTEKINYQKTNNDILKFIPDGGEMRDEFRKILLDIETQIRENKKFIIVNAPTGIGKSWIAATIGLWLKNATIITQQKSLQNQYHRDFQFMKLIKGKSNFPCLQTDGIKTCVDGICDDCEFLCSENDFVVSNTGTKNEQIIISPNSKFFNSEKEICKYWEQRKRGELSSFSVYNSQGYLSTQFEKEENNSTQQDKLLICDEAQNLEDMLVKAGSLQIEDSICDKIEATNLKEGIREAVKKGNINSLVEKLDEVLEKCKEHLISIKKHNSCSKYLISRQHLNLHPELCSKHKTTQRKTCKDCLKRVKFIENGDCFRCKKHTPYDVSNSICNTDHSKINQIMIQDIDERKRELENKLKTIKDSLEMMKNQNENNFYIISQANLENSIFKIRLEPIIIESIAKKLFKPFKHVIFFSATINKEIFPRDLGLKKFAFLEYNSPIPIERRQIFRRYVGSINQENRKKIFQNQIPKTIDDILNNFPDEKGIIHVTRFEDIDDIMTNISEKNKNRLIRQIDGESPEELITRHTLANKNSVIIAPKCWEGIDLKDELGRFVIVTKFPWMFLGD